MKLIQDSSKNQTASELNRSPAPRRSAMRVAVVQALFNTVLRAHVSKDGRRDIVSLSMGLGYRYAKHLRTL